MKLEILFVDEKYTAKNKWIPIVAKITTDKEIEIAEKIDLRAIHLIQGQESKLGTYGICHLGLLNDTFLITPLKPHYILYNVYDSVEEYSIESGIYEVYLKLKVYEHIGNGRFKGIDLESSRPITIVDG